MPGDGVLVGAVGEGVGVRHVDFHLVFEGFDLVGNAIAVIRLGVNVKLSSQQDAVQLMSGIHGTLADLTHDGGSWQITGCSVLATPAAVRQDSDGHWLCTSTVQVRATFYLEE